MPQITLKDAYLKFGEHPLLDHISLQIDQHDKIAIVGRNGAGKSTLLKVLAKQAPLDDGEVIYEKHLHVAYFQQDNYPVLTGAVLEALLTQIPDHIAEEFQYNTQFLIKKYLAELNIDEQAAIESLSGGQLRRAWLAFTLAQQANVYFLDEPTNHLDIATLAWLLGTLKKLKATLILISHDRHFMQSLCSKYIDLEHGKIKQFSGTYLEFIQFREQTWEAERTATKLANKVLAQEEAWIRQGIKARRTRNEGRVRRLKSLRAEAQARRSQLGNIALKHHNDNPTGKELMVIKNADIGYANKTLIQDFSSIIFRGDKIAIIGPNGSGKTSLINTLLGNQSLLKGSLKQRQDLKIAYFDQTKQQLDLEKTVADFVGQGRSFLTIGEEKIHIASYLKQFLFDYNEGQTKISALSGGQKNRVLLAYALSFAVDILILDEPTNDLDIETLEVLENYLTEINTTLLLTSHDRFFINEVATSLWCIQPNHTLLQFDGSLDDYDQFIKNQSKTDNQQKVASSATVNKSKQNKKTKLSYHEQRLLESLPIDIEQLEEQLQQLQQQMADPSFYTQEQAHIVKTQQQLASLENEIAKLYEQWEALSLKEAQLQK